LIDRDPVRAKPGRVFAICVWSVFYVSYVFLVVTPIRVVVTLIRVV